MLNKSLILLILVVITISGCSLLSIEGSGKEKTEVRTLDSFTSIELNTSADVNVTFGEVQSLFITADDNLLEYIETDVESSKLIIDQSESFNSKVGVTVDVVISSLNRVDLDGSGDIDIKSIHANSFVSRINGSGSITATGTVDSLDLLIDGSGDINMYDLIAGSVKAKIDGSGNINLYGKESLVAEVNGSGSIRYKGQCSVKSEVSGSGSIDRAK